MPSRLDALVKKLEAGDSLTAQDFKRVARLQLLDVAIADEQFIQAVNVEEQALNGQLDEYLRNN